jgi:hypothetical protein
VDGDGHAYITGYTTSTEATFPVAVGPELHYRGGIDAFVARVNASGTALDYCGYVGGAGDDIGSGIAVDGAGFAYVAGCTHSTESTFPVLVGPDTTYNGSTYDAFVAKVSSTGTGLIYCGYIGGDGTDIGNGIAVDGAGNAYVVGETESRPATFPVVLGPNLDFGGGRDGFVAKVNASGTSLAYCGYIGGNADDNCSGIAVDGLGFAYVVGTTGSPFNFQVKVGPDLTYNGGESDAFVAKVNSSGTGIVYSGYIGGSARDKGCGIAVDASGNAYVAGSTTSTEATFPVTVGPDLTFNGPLTSPHPDAFVAKITSWDSWSPKHAVGDYDADGRNEIAVDFGTNGVWIWDSGSWTVLTGLDPANMLAADVNGDGADEIFLSFRPGGLWVVVGGTGHGISPKYAEGMAAGDVDADGIDEVVCDFGADGLWLFDGGNWVQLTGADADFVVTANVDGIGGKEIVGDFGGKGLWLWNSGVWTQLSGLDADHLSLGKLAGTPYILACFWTAGPWLWTASGGWTQLNGLKADPVITADTDGDGDSEVIAYLGAFGLWRWDSGSWTQITNDKPEAMVRADVDGDGADEIVGDFGVLGMWIWNSGAWTQIKYWNPDDMFAADLDRDGRDEIVTDVGEAGLWIWDDGNWTIISSSNPD